MAKKDKDSHDNGNRKNVEERGNSGKAKKSKGSEDIDVDVPVNTARACKNPPFCQDEVPDLPGAPSVKIKNAAPSFSRSTRLYPSIDRTTIAPGKRGYAPLKMRR